MVRRLRGRCQRLGRASLPLRARSGPRGERRAARGGSPGSSRRGVRRAREVAAASHNSESPARGGEERGASRVTPLCPPETWGREQQGAPDATGRIWGDPGKLGWSGRRTTEPGEGPQRRCRIKRSQTTRSGEAGLRPHSASLPASRARCRAPVASGCPPHTGGSIVKRDLVPSALGQRERRRVGGDAPSS